MSGRLLLGLLTIVVLKSLGLNLKELGYVLLDEKITVVYSRIGIRRTTTRYLGESVQHFTVLLKNKCQRDKDKLLGF